MLPRGHSTLSLGLLTVAIGYATITYGGDAPNDANVVLLIVGFAAIFSSFTAPAARTIPHRQRLIDFFALLFPAYAVFQLIPLPLDVLRVISPGRAELTAALGGVTAPPYFVPLSISPQNGFIYLSRIGAYALIFLLARQVVRERPKSGWICAVPLMVTGVMEATWGLARRLPYGAPVTGTYFNRNHFAGLLEMTLPFVVLYGIAILYRGKQRAGFAGSHALAVCGLLTGSVVMFLAIAFSLSKMGFVSALGSLFVVALLGLVGTLSGWKRSMLLVVVILVGLAAFVYLPPTELVEQYGTVATERTTEGRMPILRDTAHLIRAYPLFGIGLGNFFPGLLRYQSSGLDLAWTAAHNDYAQLLAELGVVGWLVIAGFISALFMRGVRAALFPTTYDTRLLALACVGGVTAILMHSLTDFNTYVLANAMVLSWILGISAGLLASDGSSTPALSVGSHIVQGFLLGAGCLVTMYSSASLLYLHRYSASPAAERVFCRFGICDTDGALVARRHQHGVTTNGELPPSELLIYLPRDPAAPYRWEDLGKALQRTGATERARYCFGRALALAPKAPATLLTVADFYFDIGETGTALELVSRSLQAGPAFDRAVFATLEDRHIAVDDVLRHISLDGRSSQVYFRRLLGSSDASGSGKTWKWQLSHGYVDDRLATEYVDFLLRNGKPEAAAADWALYTGKRSPGYPESNRIFNGDFESEPTGSRFDWRIDARAGAIDFDRDVRYSAERSLRIRFDGTMNPGAIGVEQTVFLKAGRYRFEAYMRTEAISTDQGVAFRLVCDEAQQQLDVMTEQLRGSQEWTRLERVFDAPRGGGLVRVSLIRTPSLKFDNLIRGTAWVDQVSISAVEQE